MEPNKERLELWCRAMESGEYEQGTGWLCHGCCYCPLGIACEVYRKVTGDGEWQPYFPGLKFVCSGRGSDAACLPGPVAEWYGIRPNPLIVLESGATEPIIEANDYLGYTLHQVAAAVRRTYLQ